jgi:sRNA-binding carbon storage regulator CsrA
MDIIGQAFEVTIQSFSLILSLGTLIVISVQLYYFTNQLRIRSHIDILNINRDIISIGIENPHLLDTFKEENIHNKKKEQKRRYVQLFMNQMSIIWKAYRLGLYDEAEWRAAKKDMQEMAESEIFMEKWRSSRNFYNEEFADFVDEISGYEK